jgi:hypothetical protein
MSKSISDQKLYALFFGTNEESDNVRFSGIFTNLPGVTLKNMNGVLFMNKGAVKNVIQENFEKGIKQFRTWAQPYLSIFSEEDKNALIAYIQYEVFGKENASEPSWWKQYGKTVKGKPFVYQPESIAPIIPRSPKKTPKKEVVEEIKEAIEDVFVPEVRPVLEVEEVTIPMHLVAVVSLKKGMQEHLRSASLADLQILEVSLDYVEKNLTSVKASRFAEKAQEAFKKLHNTIYSLSSLEAFMNQMIEEVKSLRPRKKKLEEALDAVRKEMERRNLPTVEEKIEEKREAREEEPAPVIIVAPPIEEVEIIAVPPPVEEAPVPIIVDKVNAELLHALHKRGLTSVNAQSDPFDIISLLLHTLDEQDMSYKAKMQQLNQDIQSLQMELVKQSSEVVAIGLLKEQLERENADRKEELSSLLSARNALESQLEEAKEERASKMVIEGLRKELATLQQLMNETKDSIKQSEAHVEVLEEKKEEIIEEKRISPKKPTKDCLVMGQKVSSKDELRDRLDCGDDEVCNISSGKCMPLESVAPNKVFKVLDRKFTSDEEGQQEAYDFIVGTVRHLTEMEAKAEEKKKAPSPQKQLSIRPKSPIKTGVSTIASGIASGMAAAQPQGKFSRISLDMKAFFKGRQGAVAETEERKKVIKQTEEKILKPLDSRYSRFLQK